MAFNFENLNPEIRSLMKSEIESDINEGKLYTSKRFNETGLNLYQNFLMDAVENGNEETLVQSLRVNNCFLEKEERNTKTGTIMAKVPENAPVIFAEGEFNRFYIRGLAVQAI